MTFLTEEELGVDRGNEGEEKDEGSLLGEVLGEELGQGKDKEWIVVEVKDEDVREEVVTVVVTVAERTPLIPLLFRSQRLGMVQTTMLLAPANFCL